MAIRNLDALRTRAPPATRRAPWGGAGGGGAHSSQRVERRERRARDGSRARHPAPSMALFLHGTKGEGVRGLGGVGAGVRPPPPPPRCGGSDRRRAACGGLGKGAAATRCVAERAQQHLLLLPRMGEALTSWRASRGRRGGRGRGPGPSRPRCPRRWHCAHGSHDHALRGRDREGRESDQWVNFFLTSGSIFFFFW